MQRIQLMDPTIKETANDTNQMAPRLKSLDGITLGLLGNGKYNAVEFMELTVAHLRKRHNIKETITISKGHPSEQIKANEIEFLKRSHAVFSAIGD